MNDRTKPWTDADERAYHRAMGRLCTERGYLNLAQAHALAAKDCPRGCPCAGCASTRLEATEARVRREARRRAA